MNFEIERQQVLLSNFNARSEVHGEEREPAADLKFEMTATNDILSEFDPDLKSSLFRRANETGDQQDLMPDPRPGYLPKLRFPNMGEFAWSEKMVGMVLTIHLNRTELTMGDCKVDGFRFEPIDGGNVAMTFRVQCKPDERQGGKLYTLIQQKVEITLRPANEAQSSLVP